jgi:Tol biopolymer transport system component
MNDMASTSSCKLRHIILKQAFSGLANFLKNPSLVFLAAAVLVMVFSVGSTYGGTTERVSIADDETQANGSSYAPSISDDGRYVAFHSDATNLVDSGDNNSLMNIYVRDCVSGTTERINNAISEIPNDASIEPSICQVGQYVVAFASDATDLVDLDENGYRDIFVYNRNTGETQRVSVGIGGDETNGLSESASISANGSFITFASDASNLVSGDPGDNVGIDESDIFVCDMENGFNIQCVSTSLSGIPANNNSRSPSISPHGRYVAFNSSATDLVEGDNNYLTDVFVYELETGNTIRVSIDSEGNEADGTSYNNSRFSISENGQFITFVSNATNLDLITEDTNGGWDVFVHEREMGVTKRVSVASDGTEGGYSDFAFSSISSDGRYVAFVTMASNLVPEDNNEWWDLFVHDMHTGKTERVNVASDGTVGNYGPYFIPSISGNGRYVAFQSFSTNLVSEDTNNSHDIFVHDRNGDSFTVENGGTFDTTVADLLDSGFASVIGNDIGLGGSPSVSVVTDPTHGTLSLFPDGTFVYTHDGSENLHDEFTYQVNGDATSDALVYITITTAGPDITSPYTLNHDPIPGATTVPIDANIVIHILDDGSGVDLTTVIMTVEDEIVYDGSNPGSYPFTTVEGDPSDYTITYDSTADPRVNIVNNQLVNVTVDASDLAGNVMDSDVYSFMTTAGSNPPYEDPAGDDDGDGIPNGEETLLGTDPGKKTLFVRPKKQTATWPPDDSRYVYWADFVEILFPHPNPETYPYLATIGPFEEAFNGMPVGVEIVVIGGDENHDLQHPYSPMDEFDYNPGDESKNTMDFDPDLDGWQGPHCDIMEVVYKDPNVFSKCEYRSVADGHTHFDSVIVWPQPDPDEVGRWLWDTKGYTLGNVGPLGYRTPMVWGKPLDNYIREGAYEEITAGEFPVSGLVDGNKCTTALCDELSPNDVNDDDEVEFNNITFLGTGEIEEVEGLYKGPYDRDEVLRRTLVHEMGHGLGFSHCGNSSCIMWSHVEDWDLYSFGDQAGACKHSYNGTEDIRTMGGIYPAYDNDGNYTGDVKLGIWNTRHQ